MLLSLFPLNTVLFPGTPIRLHIFEDRYKSMINKCIKDNLPFGVVLIRTGQEAFDPMPTCHLIGTTAHIIEVQPLPYGRMNIIASGGERFLINTLDQKSLPYLTGDVELMPVKPAVNEDKLSEYKQLRALIIRYLNALSKAGDNEIPLNLDQIPDNGLSLAYFGAMLLQTSNTVKQDILEIQDEQILVTDLIHMFRSEIVLLNLLLAPPPLPEEDDLPFSLN